MDLSFYRFQKTDIVVCYSDEARELVESIEWLDYADANAYQRHIIPPHDDLWTTTRNVKVISAVRSVVWKGRHIGYFEAEALASDLADIFNAGNMEGVTVQAVLDNGDILYRAESDATYYNGLKTESLVDYRDNEGNDKLVMTLYGKWLGLTVYVSQDPAVFNRSLWEVILRCF